ncbi:hypothetical protein L873DRAFT_1801351, partial [Choiromyces venosus 120613-1]
MSGRVGGVDGIELACSGIRSIGYSIWNNTMVRIWIANNGLKFDISAWQVHNCFSRLIRGLSHHGVTSAAGVGF